MDPDSPAFNEFNWKPHGSLLLDKRSDGTRFKDASRGFDETLEAAHAEWTAIMIISSAQLLILTLNAGTPFIITKQTILYISQDGGDTNR